MSTKVFVTVGTTKFDELINTVSSPSVMKALNTHGYDHLTMQIGDTSLEVDCTARHGFRTIEYFHLKPSLEKYMREADLVISHAGAGSCLEALGEQKPLVVVVNELLMDNHQLELAQQLFHDGHLLYCDCQSLHRIIEDFDRTKLTPLEANNGNKVARHIDRIMGYSGVFSES